MNYENPLIVQGDRSLLMDVHAPLAEECRNALIPFAELEKSPEHLHTYRLTPLRFGMLPVRVSLQMTLLPCSINMHVMMYRSL